MSLSIANFEYLLVLILSGIIPLSIAFFHPHSPLKGKFLVTLLSSIIAGFPFIIWDIFATKNGHWSFNNSYILGIKFLELPLEEYLFFIVIPFIGIFLWTLFDKYKTLKEIIKFAFKK